MLLGPSTLLAKEHRQSEWHLSLILPPPKESPPLPAPTEDWVEYADNSADSSGTVTLCNAIAVLGCGNILELPRSVLFRRHGLLVRYRKHKPGRVLEHNTERWEYSEDDADREDSQGDQSPIDDYPGLKAPLENTTTFGASHGGFIPLNPRGITVRPGERSSIPPTSPLLTTPPGSAAMPYVWRP
jgi:hypothetical protein